MQPQQHFIGLFSLDCTGNLGIFAERLCFLKIIHVAAISIASNLLNANCAEEKPTYSLNGGSDTCQSIASVPAPRSHRLL